MKRTKERFATSHPDDRDGISGCRMFDGEDLSYAERIAKQHDQMKEWVNQQKREKDIKKKLEKEEESSYDMQAKEINRMRGMLEDEMNEKRRLMLESVKETNLLLAKEKKDRETSGKILEKQKEHTEIKYTLNTYGDKDVPEDYKEFMKTKGLNELGKPLQ